MRVESLLHPVTEGTTVALTVPNSGAATSILLIGSSVPTNLDPGQSAHTLYLYPKKPGVLAIGLWMVGKKNYTTFLVPIIAQKKNEQGYAADLENIYFPSEERKYRFEDTRLAVQVGAEWIFTRPGHNACSYVNDPNLLCQYLAGDVSADEVKTAVKRVNEEASEHTRAMAVIVKLSPLIDLVPEMREDETGHHRTYLEAAEEFVSDGHLVRMVSDFKKYAPLYESVRKTLCSFAERGLIEDIDATDSNAYGHALEAAVPSVSALVWLANHFLSAFEQGRWGLYGRLSQAYFYYKAAKGSARFAPKSE